MYSSCCETVTGLHDIMLHVGHELTMHHLMRMTNVSGENELRLAVT